MPMVDYVLNYNYIRKNICENKAKPELNCNGKCYLAKEISGSSQNSEKQNVLKLPFIPDVFTAADILDLPVHDFITECDNLNTFRPSFYKFSSVSRVFRPPLI
jgi:hypothetical protein